jgi:hypothetical protein
MPFSVRPPRTTAAPRPIVEVAPSLVDVHDVYVAFFSFRSDGPESLARMTNPSRRRACGFAISFLP